MDKPSRYRRGFEFRIARGDNTANTRGIEAFLRLSAPEYSEVLEDYLEIGKKRRNNRTALAKLQLNLLDDLTALEYTINQYKKELDAVKNIPDTAPGDKKDSPSPDAEQIEREIFFHRAHANCIRSIGDSLAWRALEYDRAALRALCQNPVKQHIIAEGARQELREWSSSFDSTDGLAILNSVTNCLSIGDITVVKNDGTVEIVEVKASKATSRRLTRQKRNMRETVSLLSSGLGKLEYPEVEIVRTDVFPENGLRDLSSILDEAVVKGWAARRLSNFLYIECYDFRKINDFKELRRVTIEARRAQAEDWTRRGDWVLPLSTLDTIEFNPNSAPTSIFPFRTNVRTALLIGSIQIVSFLNISAIEREFERLGWRVEKDPKDHFSERGTLETGFWTLTKGGLHTTIGPAEMARMGHETLRPRVIVQVLEETLKMGPGATRRHTFTVYSHEGEIWD